MIGDVIKNVSYLGLNRRKWIIIAMVITIIAIVVLSNQAMAVPQKITWGGLKALYR